MAEAQDLPDRTQLLSLHVHTVGEIRILYVEILVPVARHRHNHHSFPVFNTNKSSPGSITFLLFSLTTIAAILYLPQHIIFIVTRAWFYINGENVDVVEVAKEAVETLVHHHGSVSSSTAVAAAKETVAGVLREL